MIIRAESRASSRCCRPLAVGLEARADEQDGWAGQRPGFSVPAESGTGGARQEIQTTPACPCPLQDGGPQRTQELCTPDLSSSTKKPRASLGAPPGHLPSASQAAGHTWQLQRQSSSVKPRDPPGPSPICLPSHTHSIAHGAWPQPVNKQATRCCWVPQGGA